MRQAVQDLEWGLVGRGLEAIILHFYQDVERTGTATSFIILMELLERTCGWPTEGFGRDLLCWTSWRLLSPSREITVLTCCLPGSCSGFGHLCL